MDDVTMIVPGQIVFGRLRYTDDRKPRNFADLLIVDPSRIYRLAAIGLGVQVAGSPPWTLQDNRPGLPFGAAVAQRLPPVILQQLTRGAGRVFTEMEVADFLRPVLDAVARGQVILGGVPAPPTADPDYVPFSPVMLPHWRFIAGDDVAEPLVSGALSYLSLRVFTPVEFAYVERCRGKLRPMPCDSPASQAERELLSPTSATVWMAQHVIRPGMWKRDVALCQCRADTGESYRVSLAAWKALPAELRGQRGVHK